MLTNVCVIKVNSFYLKRKKRYNLINISGFDLRQELICTIAANVVTKSGAATIVTMSCTIAVIAANGERVVITFGAVVVADLMRRNDQVAVASWKDVRPVQVSLKHCCSSNCGGIVGPSCAVLFSVCRYQSTICSCIRG